MPEREIFINNLKISTETAQVSPQDIAKGYEFKGQVEISYSMRFEDQKRRARRTFRLPR